MPIRADILRTLGGGGPQEEDREVWSTGPTKSDWGQRTASFQDADPTRQHRVIVICSQITGLFQTKPPSFM